MKIIRDTLRFRNSPRYLHREIRSGQVQQRRNAKIHGRYKFVSYLFSYFSRYRARVNEKVSRFILLKYFSFFLILDTFVVRDRNLQRIPRRQFYYYAMIKKSFLKIQRSTRSIGRT